MGKQVNEEKIKVVVVNKPTKEESAKKTKELCVFLGNAWHNNHVSESSSKN